jgi:hypothetical protein
LNAKGPRIGERPLQGRTVDGAVTQGFALGLGKQPYRPRPDGDRLKRENGATGRQLVIPPPPAPPPRRHCGCLAMRFARERGDAQSMARAVIGTPRNYPSASRRDRVSAYRACRARSVSPGQRPGSGPPKRPGPVGAVHRGRAKRSPTCCEIQIVPAGSMARGSVNGPYRAERLMGRDPRPSPWAGRSGPTGRVPMGID